MTGLASDTISLIIGGDLCPTGRNEALFCNGKAENILNGLFDIWMNSDLRIVNLESPLIAKQTPCKKTGPHLGADMRTIIGLKNLKIDIAGLSNNHILDHGPIGLSNTIALCRSNGIETVGAGIGLSSAQQPVVREINGVRLGIFAMADHEWSIAGPKIAGANPFTIPGALRTIRTLRNSCDHIIALLHMGKEHCPYPSPNLQDACRLLVEEGVSVVVCQHSHCPGGYEEYENGFISYGQGNFIFDRPEYKVESWQRGYLISAKLGKGKKIATVIHPFEQPSKSCGVDLLNQPDYEGFLKEISEINREILNHEALEKRWSDFCSQKSDLYLSIFAGHGRIFRKLNEHTGFLEKFYSDKAIAILENVVRCEAHRDVILSVLKSIRMKRWRGSL